MTEKREDLFKLMKLEIKGDIFEQALKWLGRVKGA